MGNVKKKNRKLIVLGVSGGKPNIDHIAHQVNVTGVGAHKNKKNYNRKNNRKEIQKSIDNY